MITRTLALLAAAILLLPGTARAASPSTAEFVKSAEMSGEFEVGSSRLATEKAGSDAVKAFANRMITDHTNATGELREAAKSAGLPVEMSTELDAKHAKKLRKLEHAKQGAEFDRLYVEIQRDAHAEAVKLFKSYIGSKAASGPVKAFAEKTLPTLEAHLADAKSLPMPTT